MKPQPRRHNPQAQRLTVALRNICKDYPAGGGILRELLQNADDAGASSVKFVLDEHSYPKDSLIDPDLAQYQGPALLAYNSATFSDTDFLSLSRIGDSCKAQDGSTTGRFGRGFNSVYNWTDSPSVVSGHSLLILDPHQRWTRKFDNPGGPVYDFVQDAEKMEMKGQMAAYATITTDFDQPFQGTIIRIPLRTSAQAKVSEICNRETTFSEVALVMQKFASDFGHTGLLFMKNVEKITIVVGDAPTVDIEICNHEEVRRNKTAINKMIKRASSEAVDDFDLSFEVEIESGTVDAKKQTSFAVHHRIGDRPKDEVLRDWSSAQALAPWVAVATQLPVNAAETTPYSFFSVLPLPIHTNQPVHIHGLFSISSDRRRLHQKSDSSGQDTLPPLWNEWLFDALIPMAWIKMLLYLAQQYPDRPGFGKWPQMAENPDDECFGISQKILQIVEERCYPLWYTNLGYKTSDSVLLGNGNESLAQMQAFHDVGVPVMHLTDTLRFSLEGIFNLTPLKPHTLCDLLEHRREKVRTLDNCQKRILLEYIVSDPDFCEYGAIELFPFEDGTYKSIEHNAAFIHRDDKESHLFCLEGGRNINLDKVSSHTLQTLRKCCSASALPTLRYRSTNDLKFYFLHTHFKHYDQCEDIISLDNEAKTFISKIWDWIAARKCKLDESISSLWLVPLTNGRYRRIKPLDSSCGTIYAPPGEMREFLRKVAAMPAPCNKPILLQDSLSPASLKILIAEAKRDTRLSIKNGEILQDFVWWLDKVHEVIKLAPPVDRMRVQELIVLRLHSPSNSQSIHKALKHLEVFQKVTWKTEGDNMTPCQSWVALNGHPRVVGLQEIIPVPDITGVLFLNAKSETTSRLLKHFELATCLSTLDILTEFIIPAWEGRKLDGWSAPYKEQISELLRKHFYNLELDYQKRVASLPMVPARRIDGKSPKRLATAAQLIDPSVQSLRNLFFEDEEVYPGEDVFPKYRGTLIDCGLKIELDEQLVEDRIRCFASTSHGIEATVERARTLLRSAPCWTSTPKDRTSMLRKPQWLPAINHDDTLVLTNAENCRGLGDKLLVGLVLPVLDFEISPDWQKRLGWDDFIAPATLLEQIKKGVERNDREIVDSVLKYIGSRGQIKSLYKPLINLRCVLTSGGHFVSAQNSFRTGCERLQPYLHNVETRFWKEHTQLLKRFRIREIPLLEDLLKVQKELQARSSLDKTDTVIMIETIKLAAAFPRSSLSDLKILSESGKICAIEDLLFHDCRPLAVKETFNFTHPDIPPDIIEKLQIEPLSERITKEGLNLADIDDIDEFYQHEDVATGIADTLDRYPPKETFKEYLANADDSKTASQINWLLDERQHPQKSLLTPQLSDLQGPALLVHNDGTFSDEDFEGLKNVGRGSKRGDPSTIGKFGRGSQTMYHWTDVPMLLSGKYLLILDPLQQVLPKNYRTLRRKPGVKIEWSKLKSVGPDHLAPFEGLWGFSQDLKEDYYPGTIFRFPLRSPTARSKLRDRDIPLHCDNCSRNPLVCDPVRHYMEKFFHEARICLLFLKKVRSIDFKIHGDKTPRWSVKASHAGPDRIFPNWTNCTLTKGIGSETYATRKDQWRVIIQNPPNLPEDHLHRHKRTMKDVECGIAALVSSETSDEAVIDDTVPEPRLFSTLPLSFASNLPVHIHATFLLSGDRQSISIEKSARDTGADWNRWLLSFAVPDLYLAFLEDLVRQIGQDVFRFWPQKIPSKDSLADLIVSSFWQRLPISPYRLFPLANQLSSWKGHQRPDPLEIKEAIFDFLPKGQSLVLRDLLKLLIPTLVRVPIALKDRLRSLDPGVASVTATVLRKIFRSENACESLQKAGSDNSELLETLLEIVTPVTEHDFEELDGTRVLPLADGSLGTLRNVGRLKTANYYYLDSKEDVKLFDFASGILLDNIIGRLFKISILDSNKFNISRLSLAHVGILLGRKFFHGSTPTEEMDTWLQDFWDFWHREEKTFREDTLDITFMSSLGIDDYPIFQATYNSTRIYLEPKKLEVFPSVVEPADERHRSLCGRIPGLYRVNSDFMPAFLKRTEGSFTKPASFTRLIKALETLAAKGDLETYIKSILSPDDLKILRKLVRNYASTDPSLGATSIKSLLKELPLWPAIGPSKSCITANKALIGGNPRLLVPWMKNYERFIDPKSSKSNSLVFMRLGVVEISGITLLTDHILPCLPKEVPVSNVDDYRSLIEAISEQIFVTYHSLYKSGESKSRDKQSVLNVLRKSRLAPDRSGKLRTADELFDHEDTIFMAAFRDKADDCFLLGDVKEFRTFWLDIGLRERADGKFRPDDYFLCLQTIRKRLEDCESISSDLELDMEKVLSPLTLLGSALVDFQRTDWSRLTKEAVFPALKALDAQPEYRREAMSMLAVANPLLPLAEVIQDQFIPVCWSQTSFPIQQPSPRTFDELLSKGKPPVVMVWKHLEHMMNSLENLDQEAVPSFLSDLFCTYRYLQDNLHDSRESFVLQKTRLWLNLDNTEPESVCIDELKSSWCSIEHLILSLSYDSPPYMAVRYSLMPYETLLRELGCTTISYPTNSEPNTCPAQTLSSSLALMRREGKMLDVTFITEGQEVQAHKVVMAAASRYFAARFNGKWPNSDNIDLGNVTHRTLSLMVDFAYTDVFDWTSMQVFGNDSIDVIADKLEILLDLLEAGNFFGMSALAAQAETQILRADKGKFIRPENVLYIQERASEANAHALVDACEKFYHFKDNRKIVDGLRRENELEESLYH